jgi:hypothetical protein
MGETHIVGTCRYKPLIDSVMTKITLLRDAPIRVKGDGIVNTGFYARFTSRAFLIIHDNHTIFSLNNSTFLANIHTRRIIAMSAYVYLKNKIQFAVNYLRAFFQDRD